MLGRSQIGLRMQGAGLTAAGAVEDLRRNATVVTPAAVPRVVPTNPDDDHVLAAALAAAADLIASGDRRDLLPTGSYQSILIVTACEVLERLGLRGRELRPQSSRSKIAVYATERRIVTKCRKGFPIGLRACGNRLLMHLS